MPRGRDPLSAVWDASCQSRSLFGCIHAAQALIYERTSRIAKTHRGVRAQFSQLAQEMPDIDPDLRSVLAHGYAIKSRADYGTGEQGQISVRSADETIDDATRFLPTIEELLG